MSEHGVRVVSAVEISAVDDGAAGAGSARELHILGYLIDHTGGLLTERLGEFLADREQRTMRMAAALEEAGPRARRTPSSDARVPPGSRSAARIWPRPCSPPRQRRRA